MQLTGSHRHGVFPEARCLTYVRDLGDVIAVGVHQGVFHRSFQLGGSATLLLYRRSDLELVSWLGLPHPVNDVDVRDSLVVVGHGEYDGGAFFEGGLELWEPSTGEQRHLITDNREVLFCRFNDGMIRFTVSPVDDIDTRDDPHRTLTSYELPLDADAVELESLTPVGVHEAVPHLPYRGPHSGIALLEELARAHGGEYRPEGQPWAMSWRGEDLVVATGRGEVVLWHPDGSCTRHVVGMPAIGLAEDGDHLLVVTEQVRRFDDPADLTPARLIRLDPATGHQETVARGHATDWEAAGHVQLGRGVAGLPDGVQEHDLIPLAPGTPLSTAYRDGVLAVGWTDGTILLLRC
ncbi:hypothetical protein EII34_13070 [Arachnia propionica]|uniref:Uncharacterized protein n=1 Tax=Arachnia propionica TaxID=1750 RepID=A0A3P1T2Z9_9ACTN|nr:hypothetical protein [Arachnia propionica]RRD03730.1 hypothetical protein EII34_13070 [Arachnia propionica]